MNIFRGCAVYSPKMISEKVAVLLWCGGGLVALAALLLSTKSIRYRIGSKYLVISWLGIPVRWVRLANIAHVTPERFAWSERWFNAFRVRHRVLTIHRRTGLIRKICISPANRFVFRAELNRAREQAGGVVHSRRELRMSQPVQRHRDSRSGSSRHDAGETTSQRLAVRQTA